MKHPLFQQRPSIKVVLRILKIIMERRRWGWSIHSKEVKVRTLMINLKDEGYKVKCIVGVHIWKFRWRKLNFMWGIRLTGLGGATNGCTIMEQLWSSFVLYYRWEQWILQENKDIFGVDEDMKHIVGLPQKLDVFVGKWIFNRMEICGGVKRLWWNLWSCLKET